MKGTILTTNGDIAGGLVLSRLSELFNPASVATRVMGLSLADDQRALALVVGDEESNVGLADLDAQAAKAHHNNIVVFKVINST